VQVNKVSGYDRAVRREPLAPTDLARVPQWVEALAAHAQGIRSFAERAAAEAEAAAAAAGGGGGATALGAPSWAWVLDALGDAGSLGGGAPGAARAAAPLPAHGVVLATLAGAGKLDDAEAAVRGLLARGARKSDEHSLAACGDFGAAMAALAPVLAPHACTLVDADAAARTVRVQALGEAAALRGERELLRWVANAVAAALAAEAQKGAITFPAEWEGGPFDASVPGAKFFDVAPGSPEFAAVQRRFVEPPPGVQTASFACTVLRIERVQNPLAWSAYFRKRAAVAAIDRNAGDAGELYLKHGTRGTDPRQIAQSEVGLDFRYSTAGFFGRASYLAEDAKYSSDGYSYADAAGSQLFLVQAAVGTPKELALARDGSLIKPPDGFDCVHGNVKPNHDAYMLYDINQAYCSYLVTYKV